MLKKRLTLRDIAKKANVSLTSASMYLNGKARANHISEKTCARIETLIEEYKVERIVLGLPKHMNNNIGDRAERSLEFGKMLSRRTGLEVVMWDERLTTVEAERTLIENKVRREDRKKYIDKIAAVFILQGYLDSICKN